jgi:hypothetical protein
MKVIIGENSLLSFAKNRVKAVLSKGVPQQPAYQYAAIAA